MARVFLGEDDDQLVVTPDNQTSSILPVSDLQPHPRNPRPTDLQVEETAADLAANGQLQNINVMSRKAFVARKPHLEVKLGPQAYVVINGCRRLAAAKKAGLPGLKAEVHDTWTENQIDEAIIRENEHRLALNPLLLGYHLKEMLPSYKNSQRQLAKALNKPQPWVSQRISLTTLHADLQEMIEQDRILFKIARVCSRLHPDLQPLLASGELPVQVVETWLLELNLKAEEQLALWKAGPPYLPTPETTSPEPASGQAPAGEGENPVFTQPDPSAPDAAPPRSAEPARPAIVIRVPDRTPEKLAGALRELLSEDEVTQLIEVLLQTA